MSQEIEDKGFALLNGPADHRENRARNLLLQVRELSLALPAGGDRPYAVDNISFDVAEGEIVCLVGESGSGKSLTSHAIMGLLPSRVKIAEASRIEFLGADLARVSPARMRAIRSQSLAMVFQEPMSALNPLQRIGVQIAERRRLQGGERIGRRQIDELVFAMIDAVGLPNPKVIARSYPFQLSGGQRQRAMIAMALLTNPRLLLADEPTTALDVTTQRQILDLIRDLRGKRRMGILFVTHDFGVVADIADTVIVMRDGRIVEQGPRDNVLRNSRNEYTRRLIDAVPGRHARRSAPSMSGTTLLSLKGVDKIFKRPVRFFEKAHQVVAARDIDLTIMEGTTVSIVGESGSGKTTLGRMVLRLVDPDKGSIEFSGKAVQGMGRVDLRDYRRQVQIVFQDPVASLNPRQRVGDAIARGPILFGATKREADRLACDLLERVGLKASVKERFPHEFSGGQRQRIAIARALALKPRLLVADEPVSALDVSSQAQILKLLSELRDELGLTMLFITHDLRVAAEISDSVIVMQNGRIVEAGTSDQLFGSPKHAYTRELIAAVPGVDYFASPTLGRSA